MFVVKTESCFVPVDNKTNPFGQHEEIQLNQLYWNEKQLFKWKSKTGRKAEYIGEFGDMSQSRPFEQGVLTLYSPVDFLPRRYRIV